MMEGMKVKSLLKVSDPGFEERSGMGKSRSGVTCPSLRGHCNVCRELESTDFERDESSFCMKAVG
jgi:hypothetical protein